MICFNNHDAMKFARANKASYIFVLVYIDNAKNGGVREYWVKEPNIAKRASNLLDQGLFESLEKVYV